MSQGRRKADPTCGKCDHWMAKSKRSRKGMCSAPIPLCIGVISEDALWTDRSTSAMDCRCFRRPGDVTLRPHYVGQRAPADYEPPLDD